MVTIEGTYQNGIVELDREYSSKNPVKVTVTFLEEVEISPKKLLALSDFSFAKGQAVFKNFTGSLGDEVINERRSEL